MHTNIYIYIHTRTHLLKHAEHKSDAGKQAASGDAVAQAVRRLDFCTEVTLLPKGNETWFYF